MATPWGAYGRPNAIQLLARAIAALDPIYPAVGIEPKTTMSVGIIRGGRSVNTIAPEATAEIDLRSEDSDALDALDTKMKRAVRSAVDPKQGQLSIKRIGPSTRGEHRARRPAGRGRDEGPS